MAIDLDLSTALNRVRVAIGDTDGSLISDSVIEYLLTDNDDDEFVASKKALQYIVSYLSKKVDQRVDEVDVRWSQLLKQYKQLLSDYLSNPKLRTINAITQIRGGSNKPDFKVGTFSDIPVPVTVDFDNRYKV